MHRALALLAALASAGLIVAAALADTPSDGKALFDANCAKCHGVDGAADTPVGKAMKAHVLKDPKFASIEAAAVIKVIRENPKHKSVTGKVTDDQLTAIAGHIRELAGGSAAPK